MDINDSEEGVRPICIVMLPPMQNMVLKSGQVKVALNFAEKDRRTVLNANGELQTVEDEEMKREKGRRRYHRSNF